MKRKYKVIIIGAGAAGLSCARELADQGVDFLVVEARSRIGGRIMSVETPNSLVPIDLGAEFIHGMAPETLGWMQKFDLDFYDVNDEHFYLRGKKLVNLPEYWEKLEKIMKSLEKNKSTDIDIATYIHKQKSRDPAIKASFISYVEGFHAADTKLMSRKALAESEQTEDDDLNEAQLFRTLQRYDFFLQKIFESLRPQETCLLRTALKRVDWSPGRVEIMCEHTTTGENVIFECERLVVTVPLGVLKSSQIEWNPFPNGLEKILKSLEMGHVQKLVFKFNHRFWEELTKKPLAFFHASPNKYFPTWWTFHPVRTPYLTAWQGGPKALEMSQWSEEERVQAALKTLSDFTRKSLVFLNRELESCLGHNWSEDPFARGAYSYIAVGGVAAAKRLGRPFQETIYFAGEGTISGAARGTVDGALASGKTAANLILV